LRRVATFLHRRRCVRMPQIAGGLRQKEAVHRLKFCTVCAVLRPF